MDAYTGGMHCIRMSMDGSQPQNRGGRASVYSNAHARLCGQYQLTPSSSFAHVIYFSHRTVRLYSAHLEGYVRGKSRSLSC
jgi:hypothetical protein